MAAEPPSGAVSDSSAADAVMKMMFSHGGRLVSSGLAGAPRYVAGQTRILAVPRSASFRDLAARLSSEMAGGAEVRALMHRLTDDAGDLDDVIITVTCDEELTHMRDEYDRLRATRPNARFRVFVVTNAAPPASAAHQLRRAASGLPPLPPTRIRSVQSDQALAASAQRRVHRWPAYHPVPMRRVQSQPCIHHRAHQQSRFAPAPPTIFASPHRTCRGGTSTACLLQQRQRPGAETPPWTTVRAEGRSGSSSEEALATASLYYQQYFD